ncbi:hypothetical protein [Hallella absiana]|uniref:hypothetical protein n=1 Tax=Hallella absiana TaxID=2925336 RepID=UPI0021C56FA7|nr:hypothetical protein [Hallella absiana]
MERKEMLDKEFVMNVGYQQLLSEFNDAMRQQLITMHEKILKTYHALRSTNISGDLSVLGKCFLGYDYSKIHPVQTIRCKKIWYMLNGSLDSFFNERYDGGGCGLDGWHYDASYDNAESLDNLLYLKTTTGMTGSRTIPLPLTCKLFTQSITCSNIRLSPSLTYYGCAILTLSYGPSWTIKQITVETRRTLILTRMTIET